MSLTFYEIVVPTFDHGLYVLERYLDHAQKFASDSGRSLEEILSARLAPDMISFGEQIGVACNKVERHLSQMAGRPLPQPSAIENDLQYLKRRIVEARALVNDLTFDELEAAEHRTYELYPQVIRGWFGGADYLLLLVMPDFFFHVATAHDILRCLGADVGKRDYLGHLNLESGGYD